MFKGLKYIFCLVWGVAFGLNQGFAQLKADFTASNTSGCKPVVVSFKDNSTGNPERWKWEIGLTGVFETRDISAFYINPGIYSVKLTIYKGNDSSSVTRQALINVYDFPEAVFAADNTTG